MATDGVPLLDLTEQYRTLATDIDREVREVFESGWFILGEKVSRLEEQLAEYCGVAHGVGVSSGTDALLIALMAEEIGPGDEVITSTYSFFATAGSIERLGAKPVLVDIDPTSFNLVPEQVEAAVTERTRAVIPVHLYGQTAEMEPILELAARHDLVVIEDAAQAIGAEHRGRRAGSMGHYGCVSFFPTKNLGAAGEAGLVVTNDAERAAKLRMLRVHGMEPKYYHQIIGGNFRLDALQAAVLLAKLPHLDSWTRGRQENAATYRRLFEEAGLARAFEPDRGESGGCELPEGVVLPTELPERRHVYNQFVIRVPRRDALRRFLGERSIASEVYYPVPFHLQECFAGLGHARGDFPDAECAADTTLALPIYPELTTEMLERVVGGISDFFRAAGEDR